MNELIIGVAGCSTKHFIVGNSTYPECFANNNYAPNHVDNLVRLDLCSECRISMSPVYFKRLLRKLNDFDAAQIKAEQKADRIRQLNMDLCALRIECEANLNKMDKLKQELQEAYLNG